MSKDQFVKAFETELPRGVHSVPLKEQTIPQATWAPTADIAASRGMTYTPDNPGGKILVGALGPKLIGIEDPRHVLTVAGSQTGKSVMLTANLLCTSASLICTDIKGELANRTARRRSEMGQDVYVLDPFEITSGHAAARRAQFNPLSILRDDSGSIIEDAGAIAEAMVATSGHEKDPHWDESARNFIEGIILHVVIAAQYKGRRTLITVDEKIKEAMTPIPGELNEFGDPVIMLDREMTATADALAARDPACVIASAIRGSARDFYDKGINERGSVLSTVRRHTRFLSYAGIRKVVSGHSFSLRDIKTKRNGVSVYLCLPAGRLGLCHRWFRLMINQFFGEMEKARGMPATGVQVLVALDEFAAAIGKLNIIQTAAGLVAGEPYHIKLWTILQDFNQLKDLYGNRWETFMANAGIVQAFAINDWTTAEYLSRRLGNTPVNTSRTEMRDGKPMEIFTKEMHPLMTPEEIMMYFARTDPLLREIIIWPDVAPMVLQRVRYFDQASAGYGWFAGKYD
ncbi:MAG: type IV secretory system conjugative DNA transfer family protein [Alphaproteobacteria bacterium]